YSPGTMGAGRLLALDLLLLLFFDFVERLALERRLGPGSGTPMDDNPPAPTEALDPGLERDSALPASLGTVISVPQLLQRQTPPAKPASNSSISAHEGHSISSVCIAKPNPRVA
ncbi:MAG: hypothetical protein ACPGYV_08710, partial [Phycisphaeraceae bacterium]